MWGYVREGVSGYVSEGVSGYISEGECAYVGEKVCVISRIQITDPKKLEDFYEIPSND